MKLISATVYALRLPFVASFAHSAKERTFSDSIVVKVRDESGIEGFGEGAPREYVTGETQATALAHLVQTLWPSVARCPLAPCSRDNEVLPEFVPDTCLTQTISDGASRSALELAILDLALRLKKLPMAHLLPPHRHTVCYSGVITSGSLETVARYARQMKLIGLRYVKVKVGSGEDVERVRIVRETMGPEVSIRVDANAAWSFDQAVSTIRGLKSFGIVSVEQPLPRSMLAEMAMLRREVEVPLMADESLVTMRDAERLIEAKAADFFNIRVSKCGGLARSYRLSKYAQQNGVRLQVGSQVGETAILSATGRHLAASLDNVDLVEGSYGTMLLAEDVTNDPVRFGYRGEAPVLRGLGSGISVLEDRLRKYATSIVELN
jgi:L-alanine-DL-glutamate epimerase-like enolase superfamily enzyme